MTNPYINFFKRFFDLLFSAMLLILLFPLSLLISILILIFMGRPFLFLQERTGKNEKSFTLIKFRTMSIDNIDENKIEEDKSRITNLGKILRKTSLDEIPELINIFIGDMSFVGPRPLLPKYLPYYNKEQQKRHTIKPGLTGWAQVNGRNKITWEEKFKYDVEYTEDMSFLFDLKIIILTIFCLFKHDNIDESGNSTMCEFKG